MASMLNPVFRATSPICRASPIKPKHILWSTLQSQAKPEACATSALELVIGRFDPLHPQVHFRLRPVMRCVREVSPEPFESRQVAGGRTDHSVHAARCHAGDRLIAKVERILEKRDGYVAVDIDLLR